MGDGFTISLAAHFFFIKKITWQLYISNSICHVSTTFFWKYINIVWLDSLSWYKVFCQGESECQHYTVLSFPLWFFHVVCPPEWLAHQMSYRLSFIFSQANTHTHTHKSTSVFVMLHFAELKMFLTKRNINPYHE